MKIVSAAILLFVVMDALGNLPLCLSAPLMLFLIEIKMVFGGTQKLFARRMTNRECFLAAF